MTNNIFTDLFTPLPKIAGISPSEGRMPDVKVRKLSNFDPSFVRSGFPSMRGSVRQSTDEGVNVINHLN